MVIGFSVGGWTTSGGTQEVADAAVLTSQAAICVAQFVSEPNFQENFDDLQTVSSTQRSFIIENGS
jgi:GH18 family chitinase